MFKHWFAASAAIGALVGSAASSPLNLDARQNSFFAVTGATGDVLPRQEIRDLEGNNPDMFNLFLAAFERWQAVDQSDKFSYYSIAAIHGQPTRDWDGVSSTGDRGAGYCPHTSNLFGTWHRPYIALIEQLLQQHALALANALPAGTEKTKYQTLANQLRFPYWDWARNTQTILPPTVSNENILIRYPNGTSATRPNPLFQYRFHPLVPGDFGAPFDRWNRTVRNPERWDDPNLPSRNNVAESNLRASLNNNRNALYNLFSQYQTFNEFSNAGSEHTPIGNLEAIHNGIHSVFGPGHMEYLSMSSFDPVFWLHHCNVDRLVSIWQRIYPDTFITPFTQTQATYTYPRGSVQNAESPLTPFHKNTNGDFFNSHDVASVTTFRYTYPELQSNPSNDTLRATVNRLYGPAASKRVRRDDDSNCTTTYMAAIQAPLMALNGPYSVSVFVGDPAENPVDWLFDGSYVGKMQVLATPGMANGSFVSGTIYLDDKVENSFLDGLLKSLELDSVLSHLQAKFHVRIEKDGCEVPREQVPDLKVSVFSTEVQKAASEFEFPTWLNLAEHTDITDGWQAWNWTGRQ